jgi:uncharacterized protein
MATTYTYPGVYIQETPSAVHPITGVPTSITAFVGYTGRGIDNRAQQIFSFADYERLFGGLASNSEVSYAVQQFFQNGGSQAWVVRTGMHYSSPTAGFANVEFGTTGLGVLTFTALSSGQWANGQLLIDVDVQGLDLTSATGDPLAFNLTVTNLADGTTEYFPSVTLNNSYQNYVVAVVNDPDNGSQLVNVAATLPTPPTLPTALEVTGILGTALTIANVNAALGSPAPNTTTASADCYLNLSIPNVASSPLSIKFLAQKAQIPQTVQGLAAQLAQAVTAVLTVSVPGASVVCSAAPSPSGASTNSATDPLGIRVNVLLPNQPDTIITFADPPPPPATPPPPPPPTLPLGAIAAATPLGLAAPVSANVAHYALGTGASASGNEISSTPAASSTQLPDSDDLIGDQLAFTGIYALSKVQFNLLCIPEAARALPGDPNSPDPNINPVQIYSAAIALCDQVRAMLLCDTPPQVNTVAGAVDWKTSTLGIVDPNGIAFFPRLRLADPLNNGQLRTFAPSGVVAGVYANTDATRGVWKAPAGIGATLNGVQNMTYQLSDAENGMLNPLGLNCFRTFPVYGPVLWGARTLVGADALANQWKYVPVRRVALYLESSLYQGTQWVVFEPNDEPLWSAIRLNIGSFMQNLFIQGYFQGQTPAQAYFVKCDSETTTQTDIDNGVVNIVVGFAPLVPAEFVVIQIQQLAGQTSS